MFAPVPSSSPFAYRVKFSAARSMSVKAAVFPAGVAKFLRNAASPPDLSLVQIQVEASKSSPTVLVANATRAKMGQITSKHVNEFIAARKAGRTHKRWATESQRRKMHRRRESEKDFGGWRYGPEVRGSMRVHYYCIVYGGT